MKSLYNAQADIEEGETQSIVIASEKVKADLEAAGYSVSIVEL